MYIYPNKNDYNWNKNNSIKKTNTVYPHLAPSLPNLQIESILKVLISSLQKRYKKELENCSPFSSLIHKPTYDTVTSEPETDMTWAR